NSSTPAQARSSPKHDTYCVAGVVWLFFFQAKDGIRDKLVTGVQTCALPIVGSEMILVLASIVDEAAAAFASELGSATVASLLTCADLASAPLNLHHPNFEASTITVGGEAISVGLLTGVVNVLPVILPDEILFYDEAEREYQAAEMHALLTFFLTRVACPVINRATATSLTGPFLNPFGWRQLARSLGIAVANLQMRSDTSVNPFAVPAGSDSVEGA